jgi:ribosomal protein S18 acetylase RimI-like enzyme
MSESLNLRKPQEEFAVPEKPHETAIHSLESGRFPAGADINKRRDLLNFIYGDFGDAVLEKYAQVISGIDSATDFIRTTFGIAATDEVIRQTKENLLRRADALIKKYFADDIDWLLQFDANGEMKPELERELDMIDSGTILFTSVFQALIENGEKISLKEIANSEFGKYRAEDIEDGDRSEMISIYGENQSGNYENKNQLIGAFKENLDGRNTTIYLFKYSDKIQSFIAFTTIEDGTIHASAFNVAPDARGYRIGEAMLHEAIDTEARGHILTGDCDSKLPISAKYMETGWVATRYWDDNGEKILDIRRDDQKNEQYAGKRLGVEDIITGRVPSEMVIKTAAEQKDLPFELCNQGYVLTNQYYGVFESASPAHTT